MPFPEKHAHEAGSAHDPLVDLSPLLRHNPLWAVEVIQHLPIPLITVSCADGRILFANERVETFLGWKASKLYQRGYEELFPHIPDRKRLKGVFNRTGRVCGHVMHAKRRDGREVRISCWGQRTVLNRIECVILMFFEATDRAEERSELAERCGSLERMLNVSERQRELIGYEIHDTFVQDMVTALMHLDAYRWAAQSVSEKATRELELTAEALRDGVKQARRLIDRVQPPDLEAAGLVGALRCVIDRTSTHADLPIDFSADLSFPRLPAEYEMTIYRMVQECLNNIIRHSQTPRARVALRSREEELEVEVRDWGVGFDPASVDGNRYGLMGIRHRVRLLNGQTEITSRPQWGTRVTIRLPLDVPVEQALDT